MSTNSPVYLDYAAATPLDKRVFAVMQPMLEDVFYNPSAAYLAAKESKMALASAKQKLGLVIGARAEELVITAGATESVNLAIQGVMKAFPDGHTVSSPIEHQAVLETVKLYPHSLCDVSEQGIVQPESIKKLIKDDTVLITIGYANSELGSVQPLRKIAETIAEARQTRLKAGNKTPLYFHTDASQAAGLLDLHVSRLGVDLLTLNAAKCYGPKQTGLLWVSSNVLIKPLIYGGGQERGLRSGSEAVANAVGFAEALSIASEKRKSESHRLSNLRDLLQKLITEALPDTIVNGSIKRRLPNFLHLAWEGIDAERLVYALDERGVMVATGSACAANKGTRSHVLTAVDMPENVADGSLRLSLGRLTDEASVRRAADMIIEVVEKERGRA